MTDAGPARTLILLRHGTAAPSPAEPDAERPLTARGRREAASAGAWLGRHHPPVEQIVCSPALRTRQTAAGTGLAAPIDHDDRIYGADPDALLDVLRDLDPAWRTVLLVGHAPGLPHLVGELAGTGSDEAAVDRLRSGFPPATLAVLAVPDDWWGIGPARCTLLEVVSP